MRRERWINYLMYMFENSARIGDKALLRAISQRLRRQPGITRQVRVQANIAAVVGQYPKMIWN
jgi:hypothetical protein